MNDRHHFGWNLRSQRIQAPAYPYLYLGKILSIKGWKGYMHGSSERGMEENNQSLNDLKVIPLFAVYPLSWRGNNLWMNKLHASTQWLPPLLARFVRNGEVIFSFLSVSRFKLRTEELEGNFRNRILAMTGYKTPYFHADQLESLYFAILLSRLT